MSRTLLRPVAFAGPDAAETVERLYRLEPRFLPIEVPAASNLAAALAGLAPLGFLGAVLTGPAQTEALRLVSRRAHAADRDGAVDAIALHGPETFGSHVLEDALSLALDRAGFRPFGATAVVLCGGPAALAATQLARTGLRAIVLAAPDRPAAERLARAVPAGIETHAVTLEESRLDDLLATADLLVHASADARLDPRKLGPFHTLLEAATETSLAVSLERAGGQVIAHRAVAAAALAARLEFVTGVRLDPAELE